GSVGRDNPEGCRTTSFQLGFGVVVRQASSLSLGVTGGPGYLRAIRKPPQAPRPRPQAQKGAVRG
ncbi:MAG: hypothetical protein JSU96_11310, partial [Acidobacteriota bacterium]